MNPLFGLSGSGSDWPDTRPCQPLPAPPPACLHSAQWTPRRLRAHCTRCVPLHGRDVTMSTQRLFEACFTLEALHDASQHKSWRFLCQVLSVLGRREVGASRDAKYTTRGEGPQYVPLLVRHKSRASPVTLFRFVLRIQGRNQDPPGALA